MKTIIAGGRDVTNFNHVRQAVLDVGWAITEVVSGGARGADTLGEKWAEMAAVPVKRFPADWDRYGKRAGYMRNEEMANYGECLIALWDGESRGTKHMIDIATRKGLTVYVYKV